MASSRILFGQDLQLKEGRIRLENEIRACWVVRADPEPKTLKRAWNDYLKDQYGIKLKGIGWFANRDLMEAEEVELLIISNTPVNYAAQKIASGLKYISQWSAGWDNYRGPNLSYYPESNQDAMRERITGWIETKDGNYYERFRYYKGIPDGIGHAPRH
jgi:hypothetical protein